MSKSIGYKPNSTNVNKGYKTHGSFKMSGNKSGKHGANVSKPSKEKLADMSAEKFMKHTISSMRKNGKRRINMLPDTGAFH